jgi:type IV pili sensor histidine kinase/response regulator
MSIHSIQWLFVVTLLGLLVPSFACSQGLIQTGRYTAVYTMPTEAQQDPLRAIATVAFPARVETVGDAVRHVLAGTGYALIDVLHWDEEVFSLLEYSLPDVHRTLGPLTVLDGLSTLVGPAFRVSVDPVRRRVAFELDRSVHANADDQEGEAEDQ